MWNHFIDEEYHDDLFNEYDLEDLYVERVYPFKCPTCQRIFSKLSSLFQHVESPSCEQALNRGAIRRLRRILRSRLS